ncbi:phage baseplate assembly protein V [Pandoraea sputorum]|uniref:phage baseplate assembly protein V n=1 Tax=Pandoraea sputorum TaxID=93222 RepID=UPI002F41A895
MNPHALANAMRGLAQLNSGTRSESRDGTISSYDSSAHAVKVLLQPEETETGWIQLAAAAVGAGWGAVFAPSIGDAVQVDFILGNAETPKIVARFFNDVDNAMGVPAGEYWMVHRSGSFIKLVSNGDIDVTATGNLNANVTGKTSVHGKGDISLVSDTKVSITAPMVSINGA